MVRFTPCLSRSDSCSLYIWRYEARTRNLALGFEHSSIHLKISSMHRGTMPRDSGPKQGWLALQPPIVCVFPVPVWPYASIVALYPSSDESTAGLAVCT